MVQPSFASLLDLEARLGQPLTTSEDVLRAETALADASLLVRAHLIGVDLTVPETIDILTMVTVSAAYRQYTRPGGFASEVVGPYAYTGYPGGGQALFLTPPELALLGSLVASGSVYSIPLNTPADTSPWTGYVDTLQ